MGGKTEKIQAQAAPVIAAEYFDFLERVCAGRLNAYFTNSKAQLTLQQGALKLPGDGRPLERFILQHRLNQEQVTVLLLALMPHLNPSFLDTVIKDNIPGNGDFPLLGGSRGKQFRGFIPTGETALFILAGETVDDRLFYQAVFDHNAFFARHHVLWLEEVPAGEPRMSGRIILSAEYVEYFTTGHISHPKLSMDFPAQHVTTEMEWDDVVLNSHTLHQIGELENWVLHHHTLMSRWGMNKKLKPGYRALFYGPPGTGKTLTATLLGKYTGRDVFRIDLSMVVSKFIGETEKNLAQLFNRAENKDWILFFDEADALFSKRTNVRDAHDKYANQEAAYLLQRIEHFDGLVILATNFRNNIDDAFIRRFHSVIHFPQPSSSERLQIWNKAFPANVQMHTDVDLPALAKKYELTGSAIMGVVQYACLRALAAGTHIIGHEMIQGGIQREYNKEGKIWQG